MMMLVKKSGRFVIQNGKFFWEETTSKMVVALYPHTVGKIMTRFIQ